MKRVVLCTIGGFVLAMFLSCLISSCSRHCLAYPQDVVSVMPMEKVGQALRFVSGEDTVSLRCENPDFSKKHDISYGEKSTCMATATQLLTTENNGHMLYQSEFSGTEKFGVSGTLAETGWLYFELDGIMGVEYVGWRIGLDRKNNVLISTDYSKVEEGYTFVTAENVIYNDVYKISNQESSAILYMVQGVGLIQLELEGKIWTLLDLLE